MADKSLHSSAKQRVRCNRDRHPHCKEKGNQTENGNKSWHISKDTFSLFSRFAHLLKRHSPFEFEGGKEDGAEVQKERSGPPNQRGSTTHVGIQPELSQYILE
ncbi:unnamed protein product [Sphenostylis stenocarpa]|uniref:Uncharacterized protein n=1 Tax=Sphenostylis stenocarpa TaxID=92480 RepID=A0AA86TRN1_9FABA|nr:unnamed protein product [Sphenostylis stenocarpa]